jgi:hypothetical protein
MELWLAKDVHGVMIDDVAVFLDIATNAYFCLPGIGGVLRLDGRGLEVSVPGLADDLVAAGLASERPSEDTSLLPPPPRRTARAVLKELGLAPQARARGRHWRAAILAGLANAGDQRRTFAQRLPPAPDRSAEPASLDLMADLAAFRAVAPWLPFDGACLYRSGLLRRYLARLGHRVDWVFGVRTWPFAAHCWLQVGDMALDDEAERLIAYHPILVR